MSFLEKMIHWINRALIIVGGVFLVAMVGLTAADILMRTTSTPIRGTYELIGFFSAVATAFALGYTQLKRGHIAVDVLVSRFTGLRKKIVNTINDLICIGFFIIATKEAARKAAVIAASGEVTETLRIIYYPFIYAVAFGCLVLCLVFAADLVRGFLPGKEVRP